jgi:hypothetical protein
MQSARTVYSYALKGTKEISACFGLQQPSVLSVLQLELCYVLHLTQLFDMHSDLPRLPHRQCSESAGDGAIDELWHHNLM